jgi:hypothetical protein
MACYNLIVFDALEEAREWRCKRGVGGWIFVFENEGLAVLFPPHMPPTAIFLHPLTKGHSGRLIGSA